MQPGGLPDVGSLYNGGIQNGQVIYTQPGGPGTLVFPQFPSTYTNVPPGYPPTPFVYAGLFSFGCSHWSNTVEVFQQNDPYDNDTLAAICCCPMCGFIQMIVKPASDWWSTFYTLYNTGLPTGVRR